MNFRQLLLLLSCFGCVPLFVTLWTVASQASLTMGFYRQEYCSGLLRPPPRDLPKPGVKLISPWPPHCRQIIYCCATREALRKLNWYNKVCQVWKQQENLKKKSVSNYLFQLFSKTIELKIGWSCLTLDRVLNVFLPHLSCLRKITVHVP